MWLPNAKRVNLGSNVSGGPYDDMRKPKVCWHMTQGSSLAGARSAFAAYPPHIGYDPKNRELEQYVPLDRHSYAFFNGEADDEYIIQIEVVGFSESAHLMSDEHVQNIVTDLVDPLEELIGVPPVVIWHGFYGEGAGFTLASPSSPIRISLDQLREFSGHLGHQHIPGDGHWDPGRFRIDEVLRRSQAPVSQEDDDMIRFIQATGDPKIYALTAEGIRPVDNLEEVNLYKELTGRGVHPVTPSLLAKLTKSGTAVWNYSIPVSDSNPFGQPFRPAHRVVAGIYEKAAGMVADVDEEALAAALEARGIDGASPAEVKAAMAEVLGSTKLTPGV